MEVSSWSYYRALMQVLRSFLFVCLIALGSGFTGPSAANDLYADFSDEQVEIESPDFDLLALPYPKADNSPRRAELSEALASGDFIIVSTRPTHHRGNTKEPPTALQS